MKLYYMPGACSIGIHVLLEEIGKPYDLELVNLREGAQYKPAELAFFRDVLNGVLADQRALDVTINETLQEGWPLRRVEAVMRALAAATGGKVLLGSDSTISDSTQWAAPSPARTTTFSRSRRIRQTS